MEAASSRTSSTALGQQGLRSREKLARIPVKVVPPSGEHVPLPKPPWLRARPLMSETVAGVAAVLREHQLHSVCEEAMCPNIGECFAQRTATFMIMGGLCTRRCPFCDVAHGRPAPLDVDEPARLAAAVAALGLHHVVITSVDRDDLREGGAAHFARSMRYRSHGPTCSTTTSRPCLRSIARRVRARTIVARWICLRARKPRTAHSSRSRG